MANILTRTKLTEVLDTENVGVYGAVGVDFTQDPPTAPTDGDRLIPLNLFQQMMQQFDTSDEAADKTLTKADIGVEQFLNDPGTVTLTIDTDASQFWPARVRIPLISDQQGNRVVKAIDNSVTVNGVAGGVVTLDGQYAWITKRGPNNWFVSDATLVAAAPTIESIVMEASGNQLRITGTEPLTGTSGFAFTVNKLPFTLSDPVVTAEGEIIAQTVDTYSGQDLRMAYTAGDVVSASTGEALASFSEVSVQNLSELEPTILIGGIDIASFVALNGAVITPDNNVTFPGVAANEAIRIDAADFVALSDGDLVWIEVEAVDNTDTGKTLHVQMQEDVNFITLLEQTITLSGVPEKYMVRGPVDLVTSPGVAFLRFRNHEAVAKDIEILSYRVCVEADNTGTPVTQFEYIENYPPNNVLVTKSQPHSAVGFPRVNSSSMKRSLGQDQLSCFDVVSLKIFQHTTIAAAQVTNPSQTYSRILCPQEYQDWAAALGGTGKQGAGFPFDDTGPSSEISAGVGYMFAGHWLYKPYTTLTAAMDNTQLTFQVAAPGRITVGQYVCISDASGNWADAEHVKVQSKSGSTISLQARGYKSSAVAHASGSRVAVHQLGNGGGESRNWAYNVTELAPNDGNGTKWHDVWTTHVANHYDKDANGNVAACAVHSLLMDSDFFVFMAGGNVNTRSCDVDNDGVADGGMLPDGTNVWGRDLVAKIYEGLRTKLDARGTPHSNVTVRFGDAHTFGIDSCSLGQHEGFLSHVYSAAGTQDPSFNYFPEYLDFMFVNLYGTIGPLSGDCQNKVRTLSYWAGATAPANDNFHRMVAAVATIFEQEHSHMNGFDDPFHWFDWNAVCMVTNDPTYSYAECIPASDTAGIRANKNYLGFPTEGPLRKFDSSFARGNAIYSRQFDTLGGITGTGGATPSLSQTAPFIGANCLQITNTAPTDLTPTSASVRIPGQALTPGQDYVFCFKSRSTLYREFQVNIAGYQTNRFGSPGKDVWVPHVFCFRAKNTASDIVFYCGADGAEFYLDDLQIFTGNVDVFSRKFDNGIVLANLTRSPVTFDLGGTYQHISGLQDPAGTPGGAPVTSVTVPARDGRFLIVPSA